MRCPYSEGRGPDKSGPTRPGASAAPVGAGFIPRYTARAVGTDPPAS